jgi:hypothetical protein
MRAFGGLDGVGTFPLISTHHTALRFNDGRMWLLGMYNKSVAGVLKRLLQVGWHTTRSCPFAVLLCVLHRFWTTCVVLWFLQRGATVGSPSQLPLPTLTRAHMHRHNPSSPLYAGPTSCCPCRSPLPLDWRTSRSKCGLRCPTTPRPPPCDTRWTTLCASSLG